MDKYDRAIEYLTAHPGEIYDAWANPVRHKEAGCLFASATRTGKQQKCIDSQGIWCGCLVQIRTPCHGSEYVAETPALTEAILADERIPRYASRIRVGDLPVFAEWQRRLDAELRRENETD